MTLSINIISAKGRSKATAAGDGQATLVYRKRYQKGDKIVMTADRPGFVVLQAEDSMAPAFGYLAGSFTLPVPFGSARSGYSPKNFAGNIHVLTVRTVTAEEISAYRNLSQNPFDHHENTGFYPHVVANVETRNEAEFAARNAINGNCASNGHGSWPFESWGINQKKDAELKIDFGKEVLISQAVFLLRTDFPHDNYWKQVTLQFSDLQEDTISLQKTAQPQIIPLKPHRTQWVKLIQLCQDETDPSPFPALTQIEFWGNAIQEDTDK